MTGLQRPRTWRLRRGAKTEDYLAALSGEDGGSTSLESNASTSALPSTLSSSSPPAISSIDSPFQVQEYLAMLVAENPHDIERLIQIPRWKRTSSALSSDASDSRDKGKQVQTAAADDSGGGDSRDERAQNGQSASEKEASQAKSNDSDESEDEYEYVDRDVWLYEHLRRLAIDLSQPFVVTLQEHCSRETCPEMKAGEWLYLCAAHATANETECCAIDYITHTLDGATALLNSSRYFPSRINIPPTSLKHFTSIARRLYRIFAHAWYHHREIFDICEASTSLYERFLALSIEYDLVPRELLTIPSQSSALSGNNEESSRENADADPIYGRGNRLNANIQNREQEAREEEEQSQIQRRILEKRVLGPGYTQSGGGGGSGTDVNGSNSPSGLNEEDEDDDSSEESSDDEEHIAMSTASLAGLSLGSKTADGEGGDSQAASTTAAANAA